MVPKNVYRPIKKLATMEAADRRLLPLAFIGVSIGLAENYLVPAVKDLSRKIMSHTIDKPEPWEGRFFEE
jgi:hypothetical protein